MAFDFGFDIMNTIEDIAPAQQTFTSAFDPGWAEVGNTLFSGAQSIPKPDSNWFDTLSNLAGKAGPIWDLGQSIGGTAMQFVNMQNQAKYQQQLADYWKNRQAIETAYNAQLMDYLERKAAWEKHMADTMAGGMEGFSAELAGWTEMMGGIVQDTLEGAKPFLQQSKDLLEPAIAALAKGEVPPLLQPILEQAKQRARAAAMNALAASGQDVSTAAAAIEPQIDQQVTQMLVQAALGMTTAGTQLGQVGFQGMQTAALGAGKMIDPILQEFQLLMQGMTSLFGGGFPGLPSTSGPPAAQATS